MQLLIEISTGHDLVITTGLIDYHLQAQRLRQNSQRATSRTTFHNVVLRVKKGYVFITHVCIG